MTSQRNAILLFTGYLAYRGKLHRARPILPGDTMVAD